MKMSIHHPPPTATPTPHPLHHHTATTNRSQTPPPIPSQIAVRLLSTKQDIKPGLLLLFVLTHDAALFLITFTSPQVCPSPASSLPAPPSVEPTWKTTSSYLFWGVFCLCLFIPKRLRRLSSGLSEDFPFGFVCLSLIFDEPNKRTHFDPLGKYCSVKPNQKQEVEQKKKGQPLLNRG